MAFRLATPQSSLEHYHHPSQKPRALSSPSSPSRPRQPQSCFLSDRFTYYTHSSVVLCLTSFICLEMLQVWPWYRMCQSHIPFNDISCTNTPQAQIRWHLPHHFGSCVTVICVVSAAWLL